MPAPPAYLDECIDRPFCEDLRTRGFDLLTASDAGQLAATDATRLAYATRLGRVLITYNRAHFVRHHHEFRLRGLEHSGIIVLPQTPPLSRRVLRAAMMLDWLGDREYRSQLLTWGAFQQELIRGLRPPLDQYTEADVRQALGWE